MSKTLEQNVLESTNSNNNNTQNKIHNIEVSNLIDTEILTKADDQNELEDLLKSLVVNEENFILYNKGIDNCVTPSNQLELNESDKKILATQQNNDEFEFDNLIKNEESIDISSQNLISNLDLLKELDNNINNYYNDSQNEIKNVIELNLKEESAESFFDSNDFCTDDIAFEVNHCMNKLLNHIELIFENDVSNLVETPEKVENLADQDVDNNRSIQIKTLDLITQSESVLSVSNDTITNEEEEIVQVKNVIDPETNNEQNQIKYDEQVLNQNNEINEDQEIVASNGLQPEMIENEEESPIIQIVDFQTEWSQLAESEKTLGIIAPVWLKDR